MSKRYVVFRLSRYLGNVYGEIFGYTMDYSVAKFVFQCVADTYPDDDLFVTQTNKTMSAFKAHPSFKEVIWL